jgi:hypothetical protein
MSCPPVCEDALAAFGKLLVLYKDCDGSSSSCVMVRQFLRLAPPSTAKEPWSNSEFALALVKSSTAM